MILGYRINLKNMKYKPSYNSLLFFAKDKKHFADTIIKDMASEEAIISIVYWLFVSIFATLDTSSYIHY